ncbi:MULTISPECIES: enoyl-CoA hydratase/isomerase family protein [unclassified Variovorax]|uniref:enoyl-CoA hydratase/isomerase family protein n=1 Tax=unclassified Variovorax TaxID=663243 RepID=UPI001BD4E3E3|nr:MULTISPECIES: enoyl-CoA hydratase-related protein [unclassified Variovorax]
MSYPERASADEPVLDWRSPEGVAHIRFNRPRSLNAIDVAVAQGFRMACQRIAEDPQVRVVVVSGEGRAFMAGGDLGAMRDDPQATAQSLIEGMHGGIRILARLAAPVIASLHGAVAGGGLGLALACDLGIAAEGTRFNLAYPKIGASSDCATSWALPRLVGLRHALEIALLCEPVEAHEALRLGLVNRVVPAASLQSETEAMALRLAQGPREALGRLKRLVRESLERTLDQQLDAEAASFVACAGTSDFQEGVSAFLEKRAPRFA